MENAVGYKWRCPDASCCKMCWDLEQLLLQTIEVSTSSSNSCTRDSMWFLEHVDLQPGSSVSRSYFSPTAMEPVMITDL